MQSTATMNNRVYSLQMIVRFKLPAFIKTNAGRYYKQSNMTQSIY